MSRSSSVREKYQVLVYEMWFESEGAYLDVSEGFGQQDPGWDCGDGDENPDGQGRDR